VDPIEKKPLYHFLPGSRSYSIATRGCNFRCRHCQNCNISQVRAIDDIARDESVPPEHVVREAEAAGCESISYTYTEPTIFFEYALDIARPAAERGLKNIFVTNGYIEPEALRTIHPFLDAANIDLKFMRDDLYRKVCSARLDPVLESIRLHHELGIWIEVTTLIIPGYNDSEEDLRKIASFIVDVDPAVPWHVSAFFPTYLLRDAPPTPFRTLQEARRIGLDEGLHHVYTGNLPDEEGSSTRCHACGSVVIQRGAMGVRSDVPPGGACPACGRKIAGIWG